MRVTHCLAFVCAVCSADSVWAKPEHQESLARYYEPFLPKALAQCTACHDVPAGVDDPASLADMPPHNAFGERLMEFGLTLEEQKKPFDIISRLKLVADEDADGDGLGNELELLGSLSPGHAEGPADDATLTQARAVLAEFRGRYQWRPLQPVERPTVPRPARTDWVRNPIDAFIAIEHDARGLTPTPEAPRHVLLRRVYLDLTGLPPTRAQLQGFLNDATPDAYERVVDELLASPRYGERWGRHWMDVWRYSDWAGWTDGGQIRDSQPHIWRWRDWIVESLNADKGYDRMLVEMLAADEAAPADRDELRATGYLARNYKMLSRESWMQDTVNHTAQAFLGMTLGCARCHDHKYDPITQQEYYQVRAIFEPHQVRLDQLPHELDTKKDGLARVYDADLAVPTYLFVRGDDRKPDTEHPLTAAMPAAWGGGALEFAKVSLPPEAYYPGLRADVQQAMLAAAEDKLSSAQTTLASLCDRAESPEAMLAAKALRAAESQVASLSARIAADRAKYAQSPAANVAALALAAGAAERQATFARAEEELLRAQQAAERARQEAKPEDEDTRRALKEAEENLAKATEQLASAKAAVEQPSNEYQSLTPVYPAESTGRRLAFARWLADEHNPLTARVAVNHIWRRHFGQAIVPSMFDFGNNGRPPSHPALLDWLAAELVQPSWRLSHDESGARWREETDETPRWSMKHLHRLIVTSNAYRMSTSDDPVRTAIDRDNRFLWRMPLRRLEAELVRDAVLYVGGRLDLTMGGPEIDHMQGLTVNRRSLYFRHAAEKQMEFLKLFDCAGVTECYERKESVVPQQALALMNSELALASARGLARSLHPGADDAAFVHAAFETVLSRPAAADEMNACVKYLVEQAQLFADNAASLPDATSDSAELAKPSADAALRAREDLVQVLLNHNDFVTVQ